MKTSLLAAVLVAVGAFASGSNAYAGTIIPYPNKDTFNPEHYTFTATATGPLIGYFYSFNAADTDEIAMSVNGGPLGAFGLVNQTTPIGQTFNFGNVTSGDVLTFVLRDVSMVTDISSNPASNGDLAQHVYSVAYTNPGPFAVVGIPTGTFVSFEDRLVSQGSDFDYNDDAFVFTNVSSGTTPIPAALPLFATGLGGLGLLGWRRKRKIAAIAAA